MRIERPVMDAHLTSGSILAHRFRLERKIASGPNAEVWAAENVGLHMSVALMLLRPHALANPEAVARFTASAIERAGVRASPMRVLDLFPAGRHGPILVMEQGPEKWLEQLVLHA
jgi:serine/threonine-protein kinase